MKSTKAIFLFLALILPICIFLFLKFFGRNEFDVKPLFLDSPPAADSNCPAVTVPYIVHDSIRSQLPFGNDSLVMIAFNDETDIDAANQIKRIKEEVSNLPVETFDIVRKRATFVLEKLCFFLKGPHDMVVVDRQRTDSRAIYISRP